VKVYWLEQSEADVPTNDAWLSAAECTRLSGMRIAKRRADWRLGRWTAKCAVGSYLGLELDPGNLRDIELRPAPSGAPDAFLADKSAALAISLSHREGMALCAVAQSGSTLGCDLELIEPHSDAFVADFFAADEQAFLAHACAAEHDRMVALFWSAKESALKALRAGLRLDTRSVVVSPTDSLMYGSAPDEWRPLHVRFAGGKIMEGWWQENGKLLRTLLAAPPPLLPISLRDVVGTGDPRSHDPRFPGWQNRAGALPRSG
jgi:4'-phosphopantetheinyl transferase